VPFLNMSADRVQIGYSLACILAGTAKEETSNRHP
jgi:hypothetical protein